MSFLPHKKFTWADFFWGGIYPDIPRRYAPGTDSVIICTDLARNNFYKWLASKCLMMHVESVHLCIDVFAVYVQSIGWLGAININNERQSETANLRQARATPPATVHVQFSSVQFSNNIYVSRKSNNSGLWRLRSCVEASDKHNWL